MSNARVFARGGSWALPWSSPSAIRRPVRSFAVGFEELVAEVRRRARRTAPRGECVVKVGRRIKRVALIVALGTALHALLTL